ncbi:MAG: Cro/Cl family transcriptional regulator [Pseudomonadales bacterium RIFCSPHIGHO2_02_FULL_60_43]|nr:MAG: Cro/Cl family transcriptional regulator [Pseudomonadales bacterium RIFCSPHIGHO2_02_FULL_60_43]
MVSPARCHLRKLTMDMQEEVEGLAILIRDLRKHKNLTLGELAARIDRSVGFLSQVERGLSRPTVADLTAISETLGVPTTYFYSLSKPRDVPWVTRPGERRTLYYAGGITDVLASPTMAGGFSMLESRLDPGATSGDGHLNDSSEQGGFVLEGELTIWYGDAAEPVTLGPNDSFQLPPHAQFRYANLSDSPTRVLWVFT